MKSGKDRAYWLAWSRLEGVGPTLIFRLRNHFGSLKLAWSASAQELIAVDGIGKQTAQEIQRGRAYSDPEMLLNEHIETNPHFWTPDDKDYPRLLLEIPDPPPILYYRGHVNRNENQGIIPAIAIVGTRTPSDYGRRWTQRISHALTKAGLTVVSGLAEGVDTEAHRSCLRAGGRTLAVIGTGVNIIYPWTNRKIAEEIIQKGLLLSEYPSGTPPDRAHFPRRNRIIAGLCRAVLVLEAPKKSGALITAHLATDYNRDVYALPGSLDNENSYGCLRLIQDGAHLILSESHLLEQLSSMPNILVEESQSDSDANAHINNNRQMSLLSQERDMQEIKNSVPQLPPELENVFKVVSLTPISLDHIVEQANLPVSSVLSALVQLEIMGLVSQQPGMLYSSMR